MTLLDEKTKELLAAFEGKRKAAESIAQMKAMDFVKSGDNADRESAKAYLHDAELWVEAKALLIKHQNGEG